MKRIIPLALCFLLIISFTFTQPVFSAGETITWTGDVGDGLWHTAGNWNPAQVPGDGDLVIIPELADVVYEGGETTVILNCAGNLTVSDGALKVYGSSTLTNGKLDGAGDIIIHSGDLNWTGGNIEGTGKLIIDYNQELYAKASASLDRYLECRNNGKLFINNSLRLTGGAEGGGDITIHEGQTLELAGNGSYDLSDLNINNSGTLKIANTCEFVRFKYDFTQQNTGTLEFDIGGPDDFTKLEVGDEATLYGKLKINILDGYVPQPGDTFEIITYNKKYGTFSSIVSNIDDITFVPVYNATSLTLTVAAKAENVCKIGATEYATLDDALAAVQSGETIELLRDIDYVKDVVYNGAIFIDGTDITIDLNGYTLNVNNSRGPGIKVRNGGKVKCINGETTGSFNVTGYEYGVWAEGAGTVVRVNNITSRGSTAYNYGVLAIDSAEVIVENDIVVSGYSSRGVAANDGVVTVKGYVSLTEGSGESVGLNVFNEGRVVVEGSVNVSGYAVKGIIAESNASVDISGDVTAMGDGSIGISSKEAHVYVDGDVVGKRMGISARKASVIHVAGNVTSTAGNPTTEGSSRGIEINDECQIIVEGNVQSNDTGVNIIVNDPAQHTPSEIYIDGEITAPKYISIWGTSLGYEDYNGITPSGYRIYEVITDGSGGSYTLGTVFVKVEGVIPVAPTAPQDFIATPGDGQVMLSWIPPGNNGGSVIRKYEVSKDDGENWINVGLNTSYTFTGLTNGTEYIFKVRAVNGVGAGAEASATATPVASTTPFPTQPGRLYTWGRNQDGQMGDGTQIDKWIPTHIGTDEDWVAISTGASHTAALKADGSLWTWGDNHYGKLGDGTEELRQRSPVRIGSDNDWVAVDAGDDFTVALKADGSLWAWGYAMGGFEYGGSSKNWNVPTLVDNENKWIAVSAGSQHTVAIKEDGTLWGWGFNIYGELGSSDFDNYIDYTKSPVQISSNRWIAVSAGEYFTVGLKEDGSLWAWGRNDLGQLGDGSVADKFIPTRVGSDTWLAAAAGTDHVVAIKADGSLWAWGGNQYGELGNGSSDGITDPPPHPNPAQIGTDTDWSFVTAGYNHNAAIKRDGSIWLWGLGTFGRLGDGTTASKTIPQRLDVIGTWVAAACGDGHTAAILKAELTVPTAPQNFTATPGDGQVALSWTAPASDGGSAITKYQVSKDDGANWTDVGLNTTYTFTGLTNGTTYTFKVRAVNGVGPGAEATVTATPVVPEFAGGSGSEEDPYLIETVNQLDNVRNYLGTENSDKHFKLNANLNLDVAPYNSDTGWQPIGTSASPFTGTFDGGGHTISGLTIDKVGTWNVRTPSGLFGYIGTGAEIRDLVLEDVDITGCYYVGGLVGNNSGEIINVHVSGNVTGEWDTGGLAGRNNNNGTITNSVFTGNVTGNDIVEYGDWTGGLVGYNLGTIIRCRADATVVSEGDCIGGLVGENWSGKIRESFSSGTVTGYDYTGGLVGSNSDEITACYSTCTVNGNSDVGGLVGGNTGPISYSFAVGAVNGNSKIGGLVGSNTGGTDIGCYWDTETSGQSTSACGTGQSTANMKKQETFIGWDFDDVWGINGSDNNGYPFLRWQSFEAAPTAPTAPQNFTATPGDGQVALSWTAPASDGGSAITKYQVSKDDGANWTDVGLNTTYTFTGLTNGTTYTFKVRAVNGVGPGAEATVTATPVAAPISGSSGRRTVQTPVYQANIRTVDGTEKVLLVTVGRDVGTVFIEEDPWSTRPQGKMVITMPSIPGVDTYSVGIPVPDLSTSDVMGRLTVDTEAGSVTVPSNMLTGVSGISGNKAVIAIGQGDKENLPDEVKTVIGDRPLISINLSVDGKTINWSNPNAPVTVSIPYTPTAEELANPESIVIWYIDGSGNVVSVPNGRYDSDAGTVTFTTTHLSDFAVAYNPVEFNDVPEDVWCRKAVCFIAAREISKGTGNGNYSPESNLTRGDFIVLMMRAYGMVPDENPVDNFSDAGNTYYTGYLAAAKRLGITSGVGDNMFAPKKQITRQEMITLLHNALNLIGQLPQGSSGKTLMDFTDAAEVAPWAKDAMSDFVGSGVVYGSGGKLNPTSTTSRAEIAQVLYNLLCN